MKIDLNNLSAGLHFMAIEHDADCLTIETQRAADCTCTETIARMQSEAEYMDGVRRARKQRREADRAAANAIKKAGRK